MSNNYQMQASASNSREYCLRWNNHQPNLVSFFGNLYTTESFVDVTLVSSEGKKLLAHKLVLSACSPYFQHAFENNPCKHPVVILKDVQYLDLEAIVKFIYNGEVNISQDRINTIIKTANSLQVKGLAEVPADELKRVSTVVGEPATSSNIRSHPTPPPLTSSASWDPSDSGSEVPRKKLKKSASATASYVMTGSPHTNGDHHSCSIDSGVGASVTRSIDEGMPEEVSVVQKRTSIPAPPPLLPKSKSLDHNLHRDPHDSEMSAVMSSRQSYDDNSVEMDRGYDLEVADLKLEGEVEDEEEEEGEYEYFEDEEYCEEDQDAYGNWSNSFADSSNNNEESDCTDTKPKLTIKKPPQLQHSSQFNRNPEVLRVSSAAGERRRRGRPLLRQPRIKRSDNEPTTPGTSGGPFSNTIESSPHIRDSSLGRGGREHHHDTTTTESSTDIHSTNPQKSSSFIRETRWNSDDEDSPPRSSTIHQSNLPIVRVSQCSPTPPSSPTSSHHHHHLNPPSSPPSPVTDEQQHPVIVSTISVASTPASSTISSITTGSTPSTISSHVSSHSSTLLRVPSTEAQTSPSLLTYSPSGSSSGNHLVKQISQPLLPSHSLTPFGGITTGNPVIRRQNSTPAPTQQSRIIQSTMKHQQQGTTVFQLVPSMMSERSASEDSKTYIIDLVSSAAGHNREIGSGGSSEHHFVRRELKKDSSGEQSNSFSREDSSVSEEIGSSGSSLDDGLPVNRSGHCPALRPGPALGCNFCWNSVDTCGRILRRKTKYHCPECHINLCIVPCFQEYHEKSDKKKKPRSKLGLPKPSSM